MKAVQFLLSRTCTLIAVGMAVAGTSAHAQTAPYPTQAVTLIVSSAAGGTTDLAARMIADPLSKALGKPVIVDNRPGGSGVIAASAVKRANPDGYTLLVQYSAYQVITPHLMKAPFDPIKDFSPVANLIVAPQVIVVRQDIPAKTLPELISYAKAHPGKLSYASSGNGSLQHVVQTAEFKNKAETQGAYAVYINPQELANHTSKELRSWGEFVKAAKITGE